MRISSPSWVNHAGQPSFHHNIWILQPFNLSDQRLVASCMCRLMEDGRATIPTIHVEDISAVREKEKCDDVGKTSGMCVGVLDYISRETSRKGLSM